MWQLMFCVIVMRAVWMREPQRLRLTRPHSTHHKYTKHTLPHDNNEVFINILNILRIE